MALEYGMKQGKGRVLPRECTGHSKHPLPTTQEKTLHMGITRCPEIRAFESGNTEIRLIIFFAAKDGEEKLYTVSKNKARS